MLPLELMEVGQLEATIKAHKPLTLGDRMKNLQKLSGGQQQGLQSPRALVTSRCYAGE
jgi:ABC-type lipoprotein export system ATPase subunit